MLPPPVWFNDAQAAPVAALLRWFVLQLNQKTEAERSRALLCKLNRKNIPQLFNFSAPDEIDFIWEAIGQLAAAPYGLWRISCKPGLGRCKPEHEPSLVFNYSAEDLARAWLNMPAVDPMQQAWRDAVAHLTGAGMLDKNRLLDSAYPGVYSPMQILSAVEKITHGLAAGGAERLSWRQLSAGYFYGDSKYLELTSRKQWLLNLLPSLQDLVIERALLLNVHLINAARGILIIENQDSFCWLREQGAGLACAADLHLVYASGFTASALRVRDPTLTRFNFDGDYSARFGFEQEWFNGPAAQHLPLYFWGDLDFSGMAILKSLRQQFPTLTAWQPGYRPMLAALAQGIGHTPSQAGKAGQLDPGNCGCDYADRLLLPALCQTGLFLDQEWVRAASLRQ